MNFFIVSKTQVLQDLVKLRKVLENCLSSNNKEEKDEVLVIKFNFFAN